MDGFILSVQADCCLETKSDYDDDNNAGRTFLIFSWEVCVRRSKSCYNVSSPMSSVKVWQNQTSAGSETKEKTNKQKKSKEKAF